MIPSGAVLLSVPPAAFVAIAALLALVVPRRVGHAIGTIALAGVFVWAVVVPEGVGPTVTFLGFELVVVQIDAPTRLVLVAFGGFGTAAVVYAESAGFDRRHLAAALGYVTAAIWTVSVGDWLGLVIGWEAMAIASTLLVWLYGGEAVRAGYRYAIAHAIGGGLLLVGVAAHLVAIGIAPDAGITPEALQFGGTGVAPGLATIAIGLGVGLNAAAIGLHGWLADTYHRPHVAASVFLCAYTTKAAVYAAYRTFPDGNLVLAYVGGLMAVYGAAYAIAQKDVRRLLAYHIQAQVGYMLAAIGVGSTLGVAGGFAHLFNNVLYKGLLFMVAGVIVLRTGENRLDRFGAIGTRMPIVLGVFLVAALSITAVPGFNGFVSKGMVLDATVEAGMEPLRWLLLLGAIGTFVSFIKFGYYAFLYGDPVDHETGSEESQRDIRDAAPGHAIVMIAIAAACVGLGIYYEALVSILPETDEWATDPYSTGHLIEATGLAAAGLVAFALARPLFDRLHGGVDVNRIHDPVVFYGSRGLIRTIAVVFRAVDRRVVAIAMLSVRLVRVPRSVVYSFLPERYLDRYEARQRRVPGETGLKATVDASLYVVLVLLIVSLGVAYL